jgi:hypothetical protein
MPVICSAPCFWAVLTTRVDIDYSPPADLASDERGSAGVAVGFGCPAVDVEIESDPRLWSLKDSVSCFISRSHGSRARKACVAISGSFLGPKTRKAISEMNKILGIANTSTSTYCRCTAEQTSTTNYSNYERGKVAFNPMSRSTQRSCSPEDLFLSTQAIAEAYRLAGCDRSFELAVLSGYAAVFANGRNGGAVCLGDDFFFASH